MNGILTNVVPYDSCTIGTVGTGTFLITYYRYRLTKTPNLTKKYGTQ
jgi:hypothetical protein